MKKKGLLLHADDLAVGRLVTIHHWRSVRDQYRGQDWLGHACRIKAINLPYLVAQPVGTSQPLTLDVRRVALMPVSEEFAGAQAVAAPAATAVPAASPGQEDIPF